MADPQPAPGRRWLRWVGLHGSQVPPVDPDAWAPVASDLSVDDVQTGLSEEASRVTAALTAAGIESRRRAYVLADNISMGRVGFHLLGPGPGAADRIRVAVLVHNRDLPRASALLVDLADAAEKPGDAAESPGDAAKQPGDAAQTGTVEPGAPGNK